MDKHRQMATALAGIIDDLTTTYHLVYQHGLANIFQVKRGAQGAVRIAQKDFTWCEAFAAGLLEAGCTVEVRHCDEPGDITTLPWSVGIGPHKDYDKEPPAGAVYWGM